MFKLDASTINKLAKNTPTILAVIFAIAVTVFLYSNTKTSSEITESAQAIACTTHQDCPYGGTKAVCTSGCMERRDACQGGVCVDISANSSRCSATACTDGCDSANPGFRCVLTCNSSGLCSKTAAGVYPDNCYPDPSCGTISPPVSCGDGVCDALGGESCGNCSVDCGICPPPGPPGPPIPPGGGDCGDYTETGYPAFIGEETTAEGCNTQDSRYGVGPDGGTEWVTENIRHHGLEPGCVRGHTVDTTDGCYSGHIETICTP